MSANQQDIIRENALVDAMLLASPEGIENIELGVNFEIRERDYDYRTHQYV